MTNTALRLYHRLPPSARQLAVRVRGEYLRRWRYGPETDRLVEDAATRETWTAERWQVWQEKQLPALLANAARQVPFYREHWAERRRRGDQSSVEDIANWPVLEKESIRATPRAFLADGPTAGRDLFEEHTSGSTGTPMNLWWSRAAVRHIYALNEAYCNGWYGVTRHDAWAMLGGQLIVPAERDRPPFWMWNGPLNQLYMSSYHLARRFAPAYREALLRHRIRYIAGYTSSLYQLALGILDHGRSDVRLAVAFTHAEPVSEHQRQAIAEAFHCPVAETYGNAEGVSRASTCRHGGLHLWPQVGFTELVQQGVLVAPGESGELLCTGLANDAMPLIRYRIGDRVSRPAAEDSCPCGRGLPLLASVDGRTEDVLYTRDGRLVQRFHAVFIGVPGVREAQVVQERLDRLVLRCVTTPAFDALAARVMIEQTRMRMGDVEVVIEPLAEIPRSPNGKFRAVVCRLSPAERRAVKAATAPARRTFAGH